MRVVSYLLKDGLCACVRAINKHTHTDVCVGFALAAAGCMYVNAIGQGFVTRGPFLFVNETGIVFAAHRPYVIGQV